MLLVELTRRDGSVVTVRAVRPDDAAALQAAFERLSPESRYRRFLTSMPHLSDKLARYLTDVDHHDHEALIALDAATGEGVAIARFVRLEEDPATAEAAVTVADDWHGRGLATLLLELLAVRAREEGISRFLAVMLAQNQDMRAVLAGIGETRTVSREGGVVEAEVDLPEDGVGPHLMALLRTSAGVHDGPAAVLRR